MRCFLHFYDSINGESRMVCLGKETRDRGNRVVLATSSLDGKPDLVTAIDVRDRDVLGHDRRDHGGRIVARRIDRLTVEEGMQAERLGAGLPLDVEDGEID